jgi:hypothetical protein
LGEDLLRLTEITAGIEKAVHLLAMAGPFLDLGEMVGTPILPGGILNSSKINLKWLEAQRPSQILSATRQHIDSTANPPDAGRLATAPAPKKLARRAVFLVFL